MAPFRGWNLILTGMLVVGGSVVAALPAAAAQPTFERITVDDQFTDEELSAYCGFTIEGSAQGHVTLRSFGEVSKGVVAVNSINVGVTFSANGKDVTVRDVGADVLRITPDGQTILSIIGQVPFGFAGVLKIDLDTGETILEPHHSLEGQADKICAALSA